MIESSFLNIYISFLSEILKIDKFNLNIISDTEYYVKSDCNRKNNLMELHYCSDDVNEDNWIRLVYAIAHEMRHVFQQHLCWYRDIDTDGSLESNEIKEIEVLLPIYDKNSVYLRKYINEIDANAFALLINIIVFDRKLRIGTLFNMEHFRKAKKMYSIYNEIYISPFIKKYNINHYNEIVKLSVEKQGLPYEFDSSHNCLLNIE